MKNDKNNKYESPEPRAIDDAVRLIEALMDDETSPELRARIRAWFFSDEDVAHKQRAFDRYVASLPLHDGNLEGELRDSYNRLARLLGLEPVSESNAAPVVRRRLSPVLLRVAAVVVSVLVVAGAWLVLNNPFADTGMSIARSEQYQTAFLPDSSQVSVNPRSTIDYHNTDEARTAELSGEAFFKVRRDEARPFVVATTHLKVNVLGTEFSVRDFSEENRSTVSLFEGSISVETGGETRHLTRGERLEYDNLSGEVSISQIASHEMVEKGYKPLLKFNGATFREVLDALAAYHGVEIALAPEIDASTGNLMADFEDRPLNDALELLLRTGGERWSYRTSDDRIVIYEK